MKIVQPEAKIVRCTPNPLELIEECGRACWRSEKATKIDSAEGFVRMLIKEKHESVLEHASATFRFVTDRGVTHEMVRHRLVAYSQESTRYCNYGKDKFGNEIAVIQPPDLSKDEFERWLQTMSQVEAAYLWLIGHGVKPQIARSVLPNSLKTLIYMTCNFREWRHVLRLRTSPAAHPQIREVMMKVFDWFAENYPVIIEDLEEPKP